DVTGQGPSGVSGPDGHFVIENVPEGHDYILNVEASGYRRASYNANGIGDVETTLTVRSGSTTKVKIILIPDGVISGKVIDADGKPLPFVSVTAIGISRSISGPGVPTSGNGEFRLTNLPEGDYYLLAEKHSRFFGIVVTSPSRNPTPSTTDGA